MPWGKQLAADSICQVSFSSPREGDWQLWHKIELRNIVKHCEVKTVLWGWLLRCWHIYTRSIQDVVTDMNGDCWFAECFSCPSGLQAGTCVNLNHPSVHPTNECGLRQSLREQWLFKTAPRKQALSKTSSAREFSCWQLHLHATYRFVQSHDCPHTLVKDWQSS